jgi:VanZ family protein
MRILLHLPQWVFLSACVLVLALSLLPSTPIPIGISIGDKAQHALAFAGLTALGWWAYLSPTVRRLQGDGAHRFVTQKQRGARLMMGLMAWGGVIELAQSCTDYRQGEYRDWLADGVGVVASMVVLRCWATFRAND